MVRALLVRGMLAGSIAGLLMFVLAQFIGEPAIERAIALEATADAGHAHAAGDALVGRGVQRTLGLATAVVLFGAAVGGLFGLAFAFAHGRLGSLGPRATALLLAIGGFVVISLVPAIKYPPNPPAVGDPGSIGYRSALYFLMLLLSLAAAGTALSLGRRWIERQGPWNGALLGVGLFVALVAAVQLLLPALDEVPDGFPATLLWQFRLASLGLQLALWAAIGLLFGALAERRRYPLAGAG